MKTNYALSDFVAPVGVSDWRGGFTVTAGIGCSERALAFAQAHDDYQSILYELLFKIFINK